MYRQNKSCGEIKTEQKKGMDAVKEIDKLFIFGKPGAGKTTFLKYITLQAIRGKLEPTRLPIFVPLKEFSDKLKKSKMSLTLWDYIIEQFDICDFPEADNFLEHLLKKGKAIVLCDGLDEVNEENDLRKDVIQQLTDFSNKYNRNQFIFTCRIAAAEYVFKHFTYVEMADFDDAQIHSFVCRWFAEDEIKRDKFLEDFEKNKHLHELARTPLLLTLLCFSFAENMAFLSNRSEIYKDAVDALLRKWDVTRNIKRDEIYHQLSPHRKIQMFAEIAAKAFEEGKYLFPQADLEKWIENFLQDLPKNDQAADIDPEAVLKAIECQHGIFVERAKRIYSFSHLTVLEYFTAKYIVENDDDVLKGLCSHIYEKNWREIFLLTAEMLNKRKAEKFFTFFQEELNRRIANEEKIIELLKWVNQKADAVQIKCKSAAVRTIYIHNTHVLSFVRAYAFFLGINMGLFISIDFGSRDFSLTFNRASGNELAVDLDSILDFILFHARSYSSFPTINRAKKLSQDMGLIELHKALAALAVPVEGAGIEERKRFVKELQKIMIEHRNIGHDWNFTKEEVNNLKNYLGATKLLVDCLNVANVSGRGEIEEGVLKAPE